MGGLPVAGAITKVREARCSVGELCGDDPALAGGRIWEAVAEDGAGNCSRVIGTGHGRDIHMVYIKEYWDGKEKRAEQAALHTKKMEELYGKEIREAIERTSVYDVDFSCAGERVCEGKITLEPLDSVSAILRMADGCDRPMAVLNFSSYKNPGGGFLGGSRAQEECLCQESFLYNVLSQMTARFYDWNNQNKNKALYRNRGMYTPGVVFGRDGKQKVCDVITCAAPNISAARRYQKVSYEENTEALRSRIRFVLDIARENQVHTLILGAYGCGVFGQKGTEVAEIFKEYLETTHKCFEQVLFAVPEGKDGNYQAFYNCLMR